MRDKGKRLFVVILSAALLFFGGYYAGMSSGGRELVVYTQSGDTSGITKHQATADYFMSLLEEPSDSNTSSSINNGSETAVRYTEQPSDTMSGEVSEGVLPIDSEDEMSAAEPDESQQSSDDVPVRSEKPSANENTTKTTSASSGSHRININTAGKSELISLNGIGEKKAEAIISYREENGPFVSVEEIMAVKGIGEGIYSRIKNNITV